MIQLIYASYATREMSNKDLIDLLEKSRQRNTRQNVTGLLLYAEKKFLQVLEGDIKDVEEIYDAILNDDRNMSNVVYDKKTITEREFPNWTMGFRHLKKNDRDNIEGFSNFLDAGTDLKQYKLTHATLLLSQFKDLTK